MWANISYFQKAQYFQRRNCLQYSNYSKVSYMNKNMYYKLKKFIKVKYVSVVSYSCLRNDTVANKTPFFHKYSIASDIIANTLLIVSAHILQYTQLCYAKMHDIKHAFHIYTVLLLTYSRKFVHSQFFFSRLSYYIYIYKMFASSIISTYNRNVALFLNRHSFISMFAWNISFYTSIKYSMYDSTLLSSFIDNIHIGTQEVTYAFKYNYSIVSFLFKFFYLYFLRSVLTRFINHSIFSHTFLMTLLNILHYGISTNIYNILFSIYSVRNSFFRFLSGRYSSRLFFFLFRYKTNFTISFFTWILSRYHLLYMNIFFSCLKTDFFFLYIVLSQKKNSLINIYFTFQILLLRLSTLHHSKKSITNSFSHFKNVSITIHSFIFSMIRTTYIPFLIIYNFLSFVYMLRFFPNIFYLRKMLFSLTYQIEHSLFSYSKVPHFFFLRLYYYKYMPPLTNAKIVCEYIILLLSIGLRLNHVFFRISRWQRYWQRKGNKAERHFLRTNSYTSKLSIYNLLYPLKGIRILCSGPLYKARRTVSKKYHLWVSDDFITGRMPLSTLDLHIDYYQSFAVLRRSNIGIKVWLLFSEVL
jgi:hypothetical protein